MAARAFGSATFALNGSFRGTHFAAGALLCPRGQAAAVLAALPSARRSRTVTVVGNTALAYLTAPAQGGRVPQRVNIEHAMYPHPGPGALWATESDLVIDEPLALYDLTGKEHGLVAPHGGRYFIRTRLLESFEVPGDPDFVPAGWLIEITVLDPRSGEPIPDAWWDRSRER